MPSWATGPDVSETVLGVGTDTSGMDTDGLFDPETREAARERFESLGPAAETVVKESTRQMGFDKAEFDERVTDGVVRTAQESLFASLLLVRVGTREEYDQWCTEQEREPVEVGHERVEHVVWHAPPFAEQAVAATFQDEREAAVGTLRRQAFGRLYREALA